MAEFDPTQVDPVDDELIVDPGTLDGFNLVLESLQAEREFLEKRARAQLSERLENLAAEEARLIREVDELAPTVEDGVAPDGEKLRLLLVEHRLLSVRLDIDDSRDALIAFTVDDFVPPSDTSWTPDGKVVVDSRELHR